MESMTISQSIFVVFYAIFWGAIFSVQGRWKMFQPILRIEHILCRFLFSFIIVNIAPIVYFIAAFYCLRGGFTDGSSVEWDIFHTARILLAGVLPAFAIFGFYRLWMGIVEIIPQIFYEHKNRQRSSLLDIEPTIESLRLDHSHKYWNLLIAFLYFLFAYVGLTIN